MTPQEVFNCSRAVWLHFKAGSTYNYFKYDGKLKKRKDGEESLDGSIKWTMVKLQRDLTDIDVPYFFAWTCFNEPDLWVRKLADPARINSFKQWKERQKDRVANMSSELAGVDLSKDILRVDHQQPRLFRMIGTKISVDTFIIVDHFRQVSDAWMKSMKDEFLFHRFHHQLKCFRPFFYNYQFFDTSVYRNALDTLCPSTQEVLQP